MTEPCKCPVPNNECFRAGVPMIGRLWEMCSNNCPSERPCTAKQSEEYRKLWDSFPKTEQQQIQTKTEELPTEQTLIQRIANFAYAMKIELEWRAKGGSGPTDEEKVERRKICDSNRCGMHDAKNDTCTACGCYLEKGLLPPRPFGKLDCSTQACPRNLWSYVGGYIPPQAQIKSCCGQKSQEQDKIPEDDKTENPE